MALVQVVTGQGKVAPLSRLRGRRRPLILAGARGFVNKGLRAAEKRKRELQDRGVARAFPCTSSPWLLYAAIKVI